MKIIITSLLLIFFSQLSYSLSCNSKDLSLIYVNGVGNIKPPFIQRLALRELYEHSDERLDSIFYKGSLIDSKYPVRFDFVHNKSEGGSFFLGFFSDLAKDAYYELTRADNFRIEFINYPIDFIRMSDQV